MAISKEDLDMMQAIINAAIAGKEIQVREKSRATPNPHSWVSRFTPTALFNFDGYECRVKPEPTYFRNALVRKTHDHRQYEVVVVAPHSYLHAQSLPYFIKWVGDEQQVDLPEAP